jgi:signal transduction histidine kinase
MKERPTKLSLVTPGPPYEKTDGPQGGGRKRLADFIRENTEQIVGEWETFARTLTPASTDMTSLALRDHIQPILQFVVSDIDSPQSDIEQVEKSQGKKARGVTHTAAETHAGLRLSGGFDIEQMVSEYRSLRASVIKLWSVENMEMFHDDIIDLTRFNESIDQALAESVAHYTDEVDRARNLFLGILGHDLRTPLNVISMSTDLMTGLGTLNERQGMLASQISESTARITQLVNDLLDLTRARFGSGLPINRMPMDMGFISHQLVDELRVAHLDRTINLDISGDMMGEWDKARIGQVFTNLIGNALQYSFEYTPIDVSVKGVPNEIILSVHNEGVPIPPEKIGKIFDPLLRASSDNQNNLEAQNLGLGLYITKDIVVSHAGTIDVSSTEEGTTFTIRLPRFSK